MKNKLDNILKIWMDKHGDEECAYTEQQIAEIATNCISLTETWLEKVKNQNKASLEFMLFNKDGIVCETLNGISRDNIANTLLDILVNKRGMYTKIMVNWFIYENDKKETKCIGELKID